MQIKPFDDLTFSDDFVFCKIMQNPEICKELLERLLKIKIDKIEYPKLQKEIRPYYTTRGVRLDVYVKDSNRIFNVEMQTTVPDNLPRRMRDYQSMIDIDSLMKGEDYSSLKESYIIFLCTKDPLGFDLPVYTFKSICLQNKNCVLDDGATKVFFNAKAATSEKDIEIRSILDYLLNGKSCDTFTDRLETLVAKLKDNEKFRSEYMAGALWYRDAKKSGYDEGAAQGIAQGVAQGISQGIAQGVVQGIAQQKAEDEKLLAKERNKVAQKDALLSSKDSEVARQAKEIQRLLEENKELKAKL